MKKYLFLPVLTLCLYLAPCSAQEEVAASTASEPQVEQVMEVYETTWSPDKETVTITEVSTQKTVTLDADKYNDNLNKGYTAHKMFKNEVITEADNSGMGVTLMSMCIVLFALIVLSLLFLFFGKVFAKNQSKKKSEAKGETTVSADEDDHDSGEVIAAIAMALDEHFNSKHDLEDTVLTIRRMKRAYSPWNSKIYNMREVPTVRRKH
ncbi:MAG: OadG family protein [Prevotella sp.]|nr:OadG family protein [Prevotella sp.]MCM1075363.1 OadG family protein [Ruminococcus sp.]